MGDVTLRKAYVGVIRLFSKRKGIMENFEWIMMCAAVYSIFIMVMIGLFLQFGV